jgi:hydroxypyruvate reductase
LSRFDVESHRHDPRRLQLLDIAGAALDAVDPGEAVRRALRGHDLSGFDAAVVLGFGKAAVGMGRAALALLEGLSVRGVLVTNVPEPVRPLEVLAGSHPVPDDKSEAAGRRVLELARDAGARDLVLVLVSGGGSALVAVPAAGLTLEDLQETNSLLLRSGATIAEVNTVRKHISAIKGGRLAGAASAAAAIFTIVISDVVGNPLDAIASGPTVPDPTTFGDALAVLDTYGVRTQVPASVVGRLEAGAAGAVAETPSGGAVFDRQAIAVAADARLAADAAAAAAGRVGIPARVVTTELEGEAREVARRIVEDGGALEAGDMLVYAGETTVTVTGDGTGGRNQELALAAAIELAGRDDLLVLALGTDGIDGMTQAAGSFGDGSAVARGAAQGLEAADHLARNDSHPFLSAVGDLVVTGATGTNVGDLILVWRQPNSL